MSVVLLVGAGLLMKAFLRLTHVETGLATEQILNTRISLPSARYPAGEKMLSFNRQLLETWEAFPTTSRYRVKRLFLPAKLGQRAVLRFAW